MKSLLQGTVILLLMCCESGFADELLLSMGGGPQSGSSQTNTTVGVDYSFIQFVRSPRQRLSIGVSYTYLKSSSPSDRMYAVSLYPQLSLFPTPGSWIARRMPARFAPFFFVRALGPSYISQNQFGKQEQGRKFAFQAQVGAGFRVRTGEDSQGIVSLSWKHFSNANLFDDNDGIDLPVVLSVGLEF